MSVELVLGLIGYACAVAAILLFAWALCRAAHEADEALRFGSPDPDAKYMARPPVLTELDLSRSRKRQVRRRRGGTVL